MIKISEFSPAISANHEHSAVANFKVVINNSDPVVKSRSVPETVLPVYPAPEDESSENVELYKHLAVSFSNILKTNNLKLIANLIDQSGKVVLSASELVTAISLILILNERDIRISYEDPDSTCLSKVSPIKTITSIKVNGYDFNLAYNRQYNELSDVFGVSLSRCLIA